MKNMSFSLTTKQFRNRSKTVTRRLGWADLKPGDVVMGCVKCMGLKKGKKVEKLHAFVVISNRRETLLSISEQIGETAKEGFPEMETWDFIRMFCRHNGVKPTKTINRIEFRHL